MTVRVCVCVCVCVCEAQEVAARQLYHQMALQQQQQQQAMQQAHAAHAHGHAMAMQAAGHPHAHAMQLQAAAMAQAAAEAANPPPYYGHGHLPQSMNKLSHQQREPGSPGVSRGPSDRSDDYHHQNHHPLMMMGPDGLMAPYDAYADMMHSMQQGYQLPQVRPYPTLSLCAAPPRVCESRVRPPRARPRVPPVKASCLVPPSCMARPGELNSILRGCRGRRGWTLVA